MSNQTAEQSVSVKIDWLTLTAHCPTLPQTYDEYLSLAASYLDDFELGGYGLRRVNPNPFYAHAFEVGEGRGVIHISDNPQTQGMMLVFSGAALGQLDGWHILRRAIALNWKPTRLDVAYDFIGVGEAIEDTYNAYRCRSHYPKRQITFVDSASGATLYIGSRSSAKMIRLYDKAAEQKVPLDWKRLEVEYKQEAAQNAAALLLAEIGVSGPYALAGDAIALLDTPQSRYTRLLEFGGIESVRSAPTLKGSTEIWLHQSVLPALKRFHRENPARFDLWLAEVLKVASQDVE